MNNTNSNKTIKKKQKYNTNKTTETKMAGVALGHSLQKQQQQQDEEIVIKKKMKLKQKSKKKSNLMVEKEKPQQQQQYGNKLKKNFKQNEILQLYTDIGVTGTDIVQLPQQQQQDDKIKKNTKQKENLQLNTDIRATGNDNKLSLNKLQDQPDENKIKKKLKQKENFQLKPDIGVSENDVGAEKSELVLKKKSQIKENFNNTDIEKVGTDITLPLQDVQEQHDIEYYHKKVYMFMKTLKRDYKHLAMIYNSCIKAEQERQRRNEEEIDQLKKICNQLQVERTDIKRKRWCRYCESEATYLSTKGTNFYCSIECEEKQNDLVNVMEEIFKS